MQRCEYCGRVLIINRSDIYTLCSKKCKSKFKNKNQIKKIDEYVLGSINYEWHFVKDIVLSRKNKFEIVASISRLIYFENRLIKKNNKEINLQTMVTLKKK
tara:strand:+ start:3225 stop:3527 length:303 start_codon:yes stop_codon:yes gene_type:complete